MSNDHYKMYQDEFKAKQSAFRIIDSLERSIRKHKSDKRKLMAENKRLKELIDLALTEIISCEFPRARDYLQQALAAPPQEG